VRIVDVCGFYTPHGGGVRTYIEQKIRITPQLGHDLTVVIPGPEAKVIDRGPGARMVMIPSPRFFLDRKYYYFEDADSIWKALDDARPDVVEVSSPWRSPSIVARWDGGVPLSLVMHADPMSAYSYRWLSPMFSRERIDRLFYQFQDHMREMGRVYDRVVCASHEFAERLTDAGVGNVVTIPMGVEPGLFSPSLRDEALRSELLRHCNLPPDARLLLGVGRLSNEKRWPMVIDAVQLASQSAPLGLVIFGKGKIRAKVQAHIAGNPHVRLFEPETDRQKFARIVASCDALVHGCDAETFCMAAAEARASGIPVIVPDLGGAADHARDGSGLHYKAANAASAAQAILTLLNTPSLQRPAARSMSIEDHFRALYAEYETIRIRPNRSAA